jgi:nicotinamide-nucleotide adenylyltransferase
MKSPAKFSIFQSVPRDAAPPSAAPTRTLIILDSSFNPPSLAHLTLATSALRAPESTYPGSRRLLLLFSVHNADKKAAPAPFEHRLAMMVKFAEDLAERLASSKSSLPVSAIDVGLTKLPYYNDKSAAIEEHRDYDGDPSHVHLTGFDTYTRIFAAKYYTDHNPPLSALDTFFEKHRLRVTIRADADDGKAERGEWGTANEQRHAIAALSRGELENVGGQRNWAKRIDIDEGERESKGVSSTKVRKAVKEGDWSTLTKLCTHRVAEWVREEGLYIDSP